MKKELTFCVSHDDSSEMGRIVAEMKEVLVALDTGEIPNQTNYTTQDLTGYCTSLIQGQRGSLGNRGGRSAHGSWCVAPHNEMPGDARVDFIHMPTYIAVATLSRVLMDFPWIAIQIPGFERSVKRGLQFCTYRKLHGAGYESIRGIFDAIEILALGKVPLLLEVAPQFSPPLREIFVEVTRRILEDVSSENTPERQEKRKSWSGDYSQGYPAALEALARVSGTVMNGPRALQPNHARRI